MIVYIIFFVFFAILAIEYEFRPFDSKILIGLSIISIALLAGLRGPEVDKDYDNYVYNFDLLFKVDNPLILTLYEPGFILVVNIVRMIITTHYAVALFVIIAFASISLKITSIRKLSINPYLTILIFFSHYFLLHDMTQIRIGLASAIFLAALPYYIKDRRGPFAGMILLATLFHYSAIFYFLILFFNPRKFNYYLFIGLLLSSFVFAYLRLPLIASLGQLDVAAVSTKLDRYVQLGDLGFIQQIRVFNAINVCNIFCSSYLLYVIPKATLIADRRLLIFLKCNIISIFTLSFLSGVPSFAFRVSDLFGLISIFCFAYLVKYLPFSKFNIVFVILLAALFLYLNLANGLLNEYQLNDLKY